jgi:hypothetical protein
VAGRGNKSRSGVEEVLGIGSALGRADCNKDLSPRRAMYRRRRPGRLAGGTSSSLHHFKPLGGELWESLRQPDDAIHRGTGDPPFKVGGLSVRSPRRGTGSVIDGWGRAQVPPFALGRAPSPPHRGSRQRASPPRGAPMAARRGTGPCHRGWRRPHVHILVEVSGVILLILTRTGQELPHDRLHSLRRPFENTSVKGSLDEAAHAIRNVEFVHLRQLSKTT